MYTLYYNARIYSLDSRHTVYSALLTKRDRIIFIGHPDSLTLPGERINKIDLRGRAVVPGFIDCHTHVGSVALYEERLGLGDCQTRSEAVDRIRKHLAGFSGEYWILGGGWNANVWPEGRPHKKELDNLNKDRPIALHNKDGHTIWMNSKALQLAGFDRNTPDPTGGRLGRDPDGELNGLAYDTACFIVEQKSESASYPFLNRCLKKFYPKLYRLGITSVHSCESLEFHRIFRQITANHESGIRICMHPPMAKAEEIISEKIRSGSGNEWFRMGGLKYFVDGSLGSQTAELFAPYKELGHSGIPVMEAEELGERVSLAARNGLSATIHAIGDKANHKALKALSLSRKISESHKLRHRIEHAQILQPEDRRRFGELNVIASMQPLHIAEDIRIADKYLGDRAKNAYPVNALLREGTRVVFGSDMPVADPDPIKGMLAGVARRYMLDKREPSWYPEHCVTPLQALHAYTRDAAFASYEENLKGTLEPGKLADFVVLSEDFLEGGEETLYNTRPVMTVLGGEIVYRSVD